LLACIGFLKRVSFFMFRRRNSMSFHIVHIHRVTVQCEFIHDFEGKK
jgi:hypothetical protein